MINNSFKLKFLSLVVSVVCIATLISSCSFSVDKNIDENIPPDDKTDGEQDIIQSDPKENKIVTLALYNDDSFNPYTAITSQNRSVLSLCYEGLFTLNGTWSAVPCIAQSYVQDSNRIIVTLRDDMNFWDGSQVTASDIVYSYGKAKSSENYKNEFSEIQSFTAGSDGTVTITFKNDNIYNINMLSIPIIKAKSDNGSYPIGSGKYYLGSQVTDEGEIKGLYLNTNYPGNEDYKLSYIRLSFYSKDEEMIYGINYGDISAINSELDKGSSMYKNGVELVSYASNKLVFLMLNHNKGYFGDKQAVSEAITHLIDRQTMRSDFLQNSASVVWYPLNPSWIKVSEADLNQNIYDLEAAKQYLKNARWSVSSVADKDANGNIIEGAQHDVYKWYGSEIRLTIIVQSNNIQKAKVADYIADELNRLGVSTTVKKLSTSNYNNALKKGEYDICVSEYRIPYNMDISSLLSSIGRYPSNKLSENIYGISHGTSDVRDFLAAFKSEMPFIPLYYVNNVLAVNYSNAGESTPGVSNAYGGIEMWG